MSKNPYEHMNYATSDIKINQLDNYFDEFINHLPSFRYNRFLRPFSLENKNGFPGKNLKRKTVNIEYFKSKSGEKIPKLERIINNQICIYSQNDKQSLSNNSTNFQTKYLEPRDNNFFQLGDLSTIPDFEKDLYSVNKDKNLNDQQFLQCPLISKLFIQKKNMEKNKIYLNNKRFLNKKYKSKSCKSNSLKNNLKKKRNFFNNVNFKLENCEISELFINFIIPDNFLIDFNIKDIFIKEIEDNTNEEKKPPSISLKDTEIFLNNICKNIVINRKGGYNPPFNGEFLEYKSLVVKVGEFFFIEKKPKNMLDYDEYNCINHNLCDIRKTDSKGNKYPLKKKK